MILPQSQPSLTHVSMWTDESGWKRVTAIEVAKEHPVGSVSARSGLFSCDLCHQEVAFVNSDIYAPHFRHSSAAADKTCPERTFANGAMPIFEAKIHTLPIKIKIEFSKFELFLGLIPLPQGLSDLKRQRVTISSKRENSKKWVYNLSERSNQGMTTWLSVGSVPEEEYTLSFSEQDGAATYWPENVTGIAESGRLFDKKTGKILPNDADVEVGHLYWLLSKTHPGTNIKISNMNGIISKQVVASVSQNHYWSIYEIAATKFTGTAATFFRKYGANLTKEPISITPLWPPCISYPYLIYHMGNEVDLCLRGGSNIRAIPFPAVSIKQSMEEQARLLQVQTKGRQQLISVGRSTVLKYTYLWETKEIKKGRLPQCKITDVHQRKLDGETYTVLPAGKELIISVDFDGFAVLKQDERIINRIDLPADGMTRVPVAHLGITVEIFQGLDPIRKIDFLKAKSTIATSQMDTALVLKLNACKGEDIPFSHFYGALVHRMKDYPKTSMWLRRKIQDGSIPYDALVLLKKQFR